MESVDVDGEEFVRTNECERDEGNLGLDGHVGATRHHGLELSGGGPASFGEENKGQAGPEGRDAAVEAGDKGTVTL